MVVFGWTVALGGDGRVSAGQEARIFDDDR